MIPLLLALFLAFPMLPGNADVGPVESGIRITELLPDPVGSDLEGEFIEIMNLGNSAVDMLNWSLSDQDGATDFVFPDILIEPGDRVVIYVGPGENRTENGVFYFHMWKSTSMLNNGGDDLLLLDDAGNTVDYLAYGGGSMVDAPPEGIEWDEKIETETGMAMARSSDTGEWFNAMPTPGKRNPDMNSGTGVVISSFYPCARASDEFVEIRNPSNSDMDVSGCYITDGEGYAYLPSGTVLEANSSIYVTQNYTGFLGEMGFAPTLSYGDCYTPSSYPQFANAGDEILFCSPSGSMLFSVSYGENGELSAPRKGEVYYDENGWKVRKIGRSSLSPLNISFSGSVTLFSAPESALKAVKNEIKAADREILINVYEFRSQEIAQEILGAIARGVEVKILVEGNPVGGMPEDEMKVLEVLSNSGADVRLEMNNESAGNFERYRYDHAKYMVVDSEALIISSENFNGDAMKTDGKNGNRGWGVVIRNKSAAGYMRRLFFTDSDLNFSDIVPFDSLDFEVADSDWTPFPAKGSEPADFEGNFSITLLPGPDAGLDEIIGAISSAEKSIYVEQFYITPEWKCGSGEFRNPLVSALLNASLRGCEVKVLLDGSYYNTDGGDDNDELAEFLNCFAAEHSVDLEARVIDLGRHGLVKVHNKGMIIDGNMSLISSFNWAQNSFTNNRELAVLIENRGVAEYLTTLFMDDWKSDFTLPVAAINGKRILRVNETCTFDALSSYDDSGISDYEWLLDGDTISDNTTLVLSFAYPGEHELVLTVRDADGNEDSACVNICIIPEESRSVLPERDEQAVSPSVFVENPRTDNDSAHNNIKESGIPEEAVSHGGSSDPNTLQYLLVVPSIVILLSAIKISGNKEKKKGHGS